MKEVANTPHICVTLDTSHLLSAWLKLGAYSTYSDDAKGPVKNPIVDESEEAELEDVHLAPGGSHEY